MLCLLCNVNVCFVYPVPRSPYIQWKCMWDCIYLHTLLVYIMSIMQRTRACCLFSTSFALHTMEMHAGIYMLIYNTYTYHATFNDVLFI